MLLNGPIVIGSAQAISVASSAIAYSNAWGLTDLNNFALEYKVAGTGTPDVDIDMEQSSDAVNWYTPNTISQIVTSCTDTNQHGLAITPICVRFLRFKVTEGAGLSDCVVTLKLSGQRKTLLE